MNFSVVIPLYNKAPYIERALKSIFDQTCQSFEIIIINDGSTDNGQEIVKKINDTRIRLINQSNSGVSMARNRGIENARYDFVAFLDADDEWLPDFLVQIQEIIKKFPDCGAYASATQTIRPNGQMFFPSLKKVPPEPWIGILPNFFEIIQDGLIFNSSSIVFPKHVLIEVGGFPAGITLSEDMVCWINVAIRHSIAFTPKRLAIYHQEAANRSNIYKNMDEEPYIKLILDAIKYGKMPKEFEEDALELIAQKQIFKAIANIMDGNPLQARQLLATCYKTKKYKKRWMWWRFWASLPTGWPYKLLLFKQRFRNKSNF